MEPGYFIQLFQFDINDGYEHDFQANKQITIDLVIMKNAFEIARKVK